MSACGTTDTVEKIGGTSMSRFPELVDDLFLDGNVPRYGRIFVVSAYGGVTDRLLEHKHSGDPGVYSLFAEGDDDEWQQQLSDVGAHLRAINADQCESREVRIHADSFVQARIEDARTCLTGVRNVCTFGSFELDAYLQRVRELLSSIGEAHSAHNAARLLRERGVNARFVDLTGWRDTSSPTLEQRLADCLAGLDPLTEVPVVTGYAQCEEGLVKRYARGYTEITTSWIARLVQPREVVIHKDYHLSTADPRIVGVSRSRPIGRTNYDVADQLANLGMEAIHPRAAGILRKCGIPLRVKHAFQPEHGGTVIDRNYCSGQPRVEIVAGRRNLTAIEVFDQDMIENQHAAEKTMRAILEQFRVRSVGRDSNANSVIHYVDCPLRTARRVCEQLREQLPEAAVESRKVSFVCAIGSDLDMPGILARCASALGEAGIPILSVSMPLRGVDARFVVGNDHYEAAVKALHASVVESHDRIVEAA